MKASLEKEMKLEAISTASRSLDEARDAYEAYLRDGKGNKPRSVQQTIYAIRTFFFESGHGQLADLTPKRARALYEDLRERPLKDKKGNDTTRLRSVDSHRNILAESKTFLDWCAGKRWIASNPLGVVEGAGRRRKHGKPQLRIDEARKWLSTALDLADKGDDGAVAAMLTLLMGLRCSEVVSRVVRDHDDRGRMLWIPDSKTEAGRRKIQIPEMLQPHLARIAKGLKGDRLLFPAEPAKDNRPHWRDWPRKQVEAICRAARVVEVSAHSMRGLMSSLAIEAGAAPHLVAATLGHTSETTTLGSYTDPSAAHAGRMRGLLTVLHGDKKGKK